MRAGIAAACACWRVLRATPYLVHVIVKFIAIGILLSLNAFFVAVEFALVRSRRTRLEAMVRGGDTLARFALRATGNLGRMLSASQLGITLASLGLGWVAEQTIGELFRELLAGLPIGLEVSVRVTIGAAIALMVITYLHVVFGELAPRATALNHPERVARLLAPALMVFATLVTPFIYVLNRSSQVVLHIFGQPPMLRDEPVHSPEELRMLVEQSEEDGALLPRDAALIAGVFEFSEKTAKEVMTPRIEIVALDVDATLEETVRTIEDGGFSRCPVYEKSIDDVVGLVLAKDLIPVLHQRIDDDASVPNFTLRSILRPVHIIPGSREVEDVLADFKRLNVHMAVVLDEYGGTAGIVSMEDLLEEIVGEILDEYDDPAIPDVTRSTGEVIVPGSTHIGELNDRFGLSVPDADYTTLGGYLFGTLGRLPTAGDRISAGGAVFTVRSMEGRRVETVAVDLHSAGDRRTDARVAG
jgi:CBS domain containing-hemolysin-like protein